MAKDVDSMIIPLLREMRAEIKHRFDVIDLRFNSLEEHLDKLESGQKTIRQAMGADTLMRNW